MFFRKHRSGNRSYLQLIAACRIGKRVRQEVIARLGRFDKLERSGQLTRLLRSGSKLTSEAMLLQIGENPTLSSLKPSVWDPASSATRARRDSQRAVFSPEHSE